MNTESRTDFLGVAISSVAFLVATGAIAAWMVTESSTGRVATVQDQYIEEVREYLAENLPDGEWDEVRWYGTHTGPTETWGRLKYRAKNAFGATDIYDMVFIWKNGQSGITEVWPARDTAWRTDDYADNNPPPLK